MWLLIAGSLIASMTLWTINYSACNNTYYVVVVALTLFKLVMLAMWAPLFIKMKRYRGAFVVLLLAIAAAVTSLVLMALTVSYSGGGCIADKAGGIAAAVLYGWPILWYILAAYISGQWMYLPVKYQFKPWWKHKDEHMNDKPLPPTPDEEDGYGRDYYYSMREEIGTQNNPNFSALRKSVLKSK
jgi:hypothetical protein